MSWCVTDRRKSLQQELWRWPHHERRFQCDIVFHAFLKHRDEDPLVCQSSYGDRGALKPFVLVDGLVRAPKRKLIRPQLAVLALVITKVSGFLVMLSILSSDKRQLNFAISGVVEVTPTVSLTNPVSNFTDQSKMIQKRLELFCCNEHVGMCGEYDCPQCFRRRHRTRRWSVATKEVKLTWSISLVDDSRSQTEQDYQEELHFPD